MKKFIVIYHAPEEFTAQMSKMSPEDMKKGMEPWMAWSAKCGAGLVDIGTPLSNSELQNSINVGLSTYHKHPLMREVF